MDLLDPPGRDTVPLILDGFDQSRRWLRDYPSLLAAAPKHQHLSAGLDDQVFGRPEWVAVGRCRPKRHIQIGLVDE